MALYSHTKIQPHNITTIKQNINSEKQYINGFIPIDRPHHIRPIQLETHLLPNRLHPFQYKNISSKYRKEDFRKFIKPDLYDEEIKQPIGQYRDLYDVEGNIKIPPQHIRNIYPQMKKIIQNRFM
jgi:hypothetical protein